MEFPWYNVKTIYRRKLPVTASVDHIFILLPTKFVYINGANK